MYVMIIKLIINEYKVHRFLATLVRYRKSVCWLLWKRIGCTIIYLHAAVVYGLWDNSSYYIVWVETAFIQAETIVQ